MDISEIKLVKIGTSKGFIVPQNILKDSKFPFIEKDKLEIVIKEDMLIIRKKGGK